MKRILAAVTALALAAPALAAPYTEGPVPTKVGQCVTTRIAVLSSRIENTPDSGSGVSYVNGIWQVSYDIIPGVLTARVGDSVRLCLKSIPTVAPRVTTAGRSMRRPTCARRNHGKHPTPSTAAAGLESYFRLNIRPMS